MIIIKQREKKILTDVKTIADKVIRKILSLKFQKGKPSRELPLLFNQKLHVKYNRWNN
jgi:hypothetical protein